MPLYAGMSTRGRQEEMYDTLTLDRKNRVRTEGSTGIRPDTVKGLVLELSSVAMLVRKAVSLSNSSEALLRRALGGVCGVLGICSTSKSDMLVFRVKGSPSEDRLELDGEERALTVVYDMASTRDGEDRRKEACRP